jgi:hypothetical protein
MWDFSWPYRDGALDAGILIHELTHGLSNRLTGGPMNSGCLAYGEDGGMNEGWSDFMATIVRSTRTGVHEDYAIGGWAFNDAQGMREYLYSTVSLSPTLKMQRATLTVGEEHDSQPDDVREHERTGVLGSCEPVHGETIIHSRGAHDIV